MKKEILILLVLAILIIVLIAVLVFVLVLLKDNSPVKVSSVKSGQEITSPLIVEGEAKGTWFFEATFPIKITDDQGNVLGSSFVRTQSDWMTEKFVPFKGEITYSSKTGGNGFLVLSKDNPSGLSQYDQQVKIPVVLSPVGYTTIKVFFNNSQMDPEISCNKVFPVEREILKIEAIGAAAINQLLRGPTDQEEKAGFSTSINQGVELQSLYIDENNVAHVDFNSQLEQSVGGSCRVSAIGAQITETLKQFPTIKDVVISINGRTEDILQP